MKTTHRHSNQNVEDFPVIRIDYKGRILYANKASFPLLREWNCLANDYLPEDLVRQHPSLLDLEAAFDLHIPTLTKQFHLDVVGFKESGYIGLYGFETDHQAESNIHSSLLVAQL